MHFIGAGSRNVVLRLSWTEALEWWPELLSQISLRASLKEQETCRELLTCTLQENDKNREELELEGGEENKNLEINSDVLEWLKHGVVLRVNQDTFKECDVCYVALRRFAGSRVLISVTPKLRKMLVQVVPAQMHHLINNVTNAVLMPDFACSNALSVSDNLETARGWNYRFSVQEKEELPCGKKYAKSMQVIDTHVVEIKPKAAWVLPFVEGIVVNGEKFTIHPLKKMQCRYSLTAKYKSRSLTEEEERSPFDQIYCPNMMFNSHLSTLEGLQGLVANPLNNFILHCVEEKEYLELENRHSTPNDCTNTKMQLPLKEIAQALDASGVWNMLGELQLYGMANYTGDMMHIDSCSEEVDARLVFLPVLDIELLYRWSQAPDNSHIEWLIRLPTSICNANNSIHTNKFDWSTCMCTKRNSACERSLLCNLCDTELKSVNPFLSFDEAVRRFYVATTAKDVSIIVTIQLTKESNLHNSHSVQVWVDTCHEGHGTSRQCPHADDKNVDGVFVASSTYTSRIGVIDLDDKHYKSLHHYELRDQEILNASK